MDDQLETAVFATPGALKPANSHYRSLLYMNDLRVLVLYPGQFDDDIHLCMSEAVVRRLEIASYDVSRSWIFIDIKPRLARQHDIEMESSRDGI